jgi:hypothetical protein
MGRVDIATQVPAWQTWFAKAAPRAAQSEVDEHWLAFERNRIEQPPQTATADKSAAAEMNEERCLP